MLVELRIEASWSSCGQLGSQPDAATREVRLAAFVVTLRSTVCALAYPAHLAAAKLRANISEQVPGIVDAQLQVASRDVFGTLKRKRHLEGGVGRCF